MWVFCKLCKECKEKLPEDSTTAPGALKHPRSTGPPCPASSMSVNHLNQNNEVNTMSVYTKLTLPDETLRALLLDRIPDAQDVRITRAEDAS